MSLDKIRREYDFILGLGGNCAVAYQLRRKNLRSFAGPIDWMLSYSLSHINQLLDTKFSEFMKKENIIQLNHFSGYEEGNTFVSGKTYRIRDTYYKIDSVHDFKVIENEEWEDQYPLFEEKLHRRINRLYAHLKTVESLLVIRYSPREIMRSASTEELIHLRNSLLSLTADSVTVLDIEATKEVETIQEEERSLEGICSIKIPHLPNQAFGDNDVWDKILGRVTLNLNENPKV